MKEVPQVELVFPVNIMPIKNTTIILEDFQKLIEFL